MVSIARPRYNHAQGHCEQMHMHSRTIRIDGETYTVDSPTLSGATLKVLAKRDPIYQVFREVSGQVDELVADHQALVVEDGMEFYTVPPAMAGLRWIL